MTLLTVTQATTTFAGVARSFKLLPPPKSRSLGASSNHWIRPQQSHQHRPERKLPSPRLVRQIAQISAGRVDVPCPFENTGHCRSHIFRPHRLAGVLVGAWTDAQHRSDHHSPTHPTYLKVRLRQVFGEDLLLNSVIKSTAVPGARRCRHPVAFATGLGLFAVIGPPFISLLDRAKGDVCEQR